LTIPPLEHLQQLDDLAAHIGGGSDRAQHELALHRFGGIELADLDHVHELEQLLGDLLEA